GTCVGDVNLDGVFNSADLILLFQTSEYESGKPATWVTGDWNGDCKFDSSDLLLAFQEGCYDAESSHVLASVVPEPNGLIPTLMTCLGWALRRRKRRNP
ncbi:MAG: PEP-CTERM sorting domain-containing protein, partial [Planctomycetales bacterium]|nr:PEP-CTERM sorting domain-containing protein [Planctomycetales bacterium]